MTIDPMTLFDKVGRWWNKDGEIDLVALNEEENKILFGEVKWTSRPVGTDIYENLKSKAAQVEWGNGTRKEYYALFSRNGFTPQMLRVARKEKVLLFMGDKPVIAAERLSRDTQSS
ncbi:MAG: DUF234 domain-containing protein [bacterium]